MSDEHTEEHETSRIPERVRSLEDSRNTWRWVIGIVGPALLAITLWAADRAQQSAEYVGATRATIEAYRKTLDTLDHDIRELRAKIMGLSDESPKDITIVGNP